MARSFIHGGPSLINCEPRSVADTQKFQKWKTRLVADLRTVVSTTSVARRSK